MVKGWTGCGLHGYSPVAFSPPFFPFLNLIWLIQGEAADIRKAPCKTYSLGGVLFQSTLPVCFESFDKVVNRQPYKCSCFWNLIWCVCVCVGVHLIFIPALLLSSLSPFSPPQQLSAIVSDLLSPFLQTLRLPCWWVCKSARSSQGHSRGQGIV